MSKPHLYIIPKVNGDQVDDDFIEAVIEEAKRIDLFARVEKIVKPEQAPLPRSNVISFKAHVDKLDSLPVFVPFDEFGKPVWTR